MIQNKKMCFKMSLYKNFMNEPHENGGFHIFELVTSVQLDAF